MTAGPVRRRSSAGSDGPHPSDNAKDADRPNRGVPNHGVPNHGVPDDAGRAKHMGRAKDTGRTVDVGRPDDAGRRQVRAGPWVGSSGMGGCGWSHGRWRRE